ncbi:MAG: hypothetical protein M1813_005219 [Trichoglossum hirsutum]|nr:MAG: hypothetical protein M1813_005219 [Trichoglossum hirsutum]
MDPLSVTASVFAILQLTGAVIAYLNDVKDAPKECQQCTIEASNLQNLLINLRYCLERGQASDPWFAIIQTLNVENGPFDQYRQALEQLQSKIDVGTGATKVKRQLAWKFNKVEVAGILARMERLKTLISIALEMDHFKLSQAIKDDTISIRNTLPTLQASIVAIGDSQSLLQHDTIMEWLSPTDFPNLQHDIITRRQEGTGQWFLDSLEFKRWLRGSDKTLFCPGIPGAGKTMIAAIAIDHLRRMARCDNIGAAYLFCNYKSQVDQSAQSLLAALLKQLVQSRPDIAAPVTHIYDYHLKQNSRPTLDDIFGALQSACSSYAAVHIVVDALDECADKDGARGRLIDKLRELQARTDVWLMCTSRSIPEIMQKFCSNPTLEVRASEEDVRGFVAGQMPCLPNCIRRDDELKRAIQDKIVESVDGMFLLARLHVDSLLDKRTKRQVLSTLERLSRGSGALNKAYGEAIERIDGQLAGDRSLARRALSWITYAQRLLTTPELCHALAIEPGDRALNNDNVYDVEDVISVCAGLVTVDEESNIIRLVHYTTQEYFERVRLEWNPGAQEQIVVACLTYSSFDTFRSGSCADDKAFEQKLTENVFFDYSARYWSEHIRPVEKTTSPLTLAFLCDEALVDCTVQAASMRSYKYKGYSKGFPTQTNGLHLTARYGLLYLIGRLLIGNHGDSNMRADLRDGDSRTPLSWAAEGGHEAVVKLLVDRDDVKADSGDRNGRTPLIWAAWKGHEAIVKLLVERDDVEADLKDNFGRTPLSWAAWGGHEAIVKLLVERDDIEADSKDGDGRSSLAWAAGGGYEAVVKLLIERDDVEVDPKDKYGQTPLSLAAAEGYETVVQLLVERGDVEADLKDREGQTPLSRAAWRGYEATVKLLVERDDVEADSKDSYGRTPLSWAAWGGHEATVKLLVERDDVEADSEDSYGRTPLSWAVEGGYEAIVKLLVERDDVEADSKSNYGQTPLSFAAEGGHEAIVKLLVERDDVEADSKDGFGRTPLSLAAAGGHEAVVKLLVERDDVEADSKSNYGQTPLSFAIERGHEAVVKLLVQRDDVESDLKDRYIRTSLFLTAGKGPEAVVELYHDRVPRNRTTGPQQRPSHW